MENFDELFGISDNREQQGGKWATVLSAGQERFASVTNWNACGWEAAVIYGPEYRNPGSDIPKALFICGGICLFAYVKVKRDPYFASLDRSFRALAGWKSVALAFGLLNLPLYFIGVVYLNSLEIGWCSTWVGLLVMALYVPLWIYSQHETGVDPNRS